MSLYIISYENYVNNVTVNNYMYICINYNYNILQIYINIL